MKLNSIIVLICSIASLVGAFLPLVHNGYFYVDVAKFDNWLSIVFLLPIYLAVVSVQIFRGKTQRIKTLVVPIAFIGLLLTLLMLLAAPDLLRRRINGFQLGVGGWLLFLSYLTAVLVPFINLKKNRKRLAALKKFYVERIHLKKWFVEYQKPIKYSLGAALTLALVFSPILYEGIQGHWTNYTKPKLIEENKYAVQITGNREQWDHPNTVSEPRLNFSLIGSLRDDLDEDSKEHDLSGIYSIRLDGSDFRTIASGPELEEAFDDEIRSIDVIKRSSDNRFIAFADSSRRIKIIDLEGGIKKIDDIERVRDSNFYWVEGESKLLFIQYVKGWRKLLLYDVADNTVEEINERFKSTKRISGFEYIPSLNRIILFDNLASVHNFKTGALMEKSPKEYYMGATSSSNSHFRLAANTGKYSYFEKRKFTFYPQGNPAIRYSLQYETEHSGDSTEFGPSHIYTDTRAGIFFDSVSNESSHLWSFKGLSYAGGLTIVNANAEAYFEYNCGPTTLDNQGAEYKAMFCSESPQWNHYGKRYAFKAELIKELEGSRGGYAERLELISEIIDKKRKQEEQLNTGKDLSKPKVQTLAELDVLADQALVQYAGMEYLDFSNTINELRDSFVWQRDSDEWGSILEGDKSVGRFSFYDVYSDLFAVSRSCKTITEDPLGYLAFKIIKQQLSGSSAVSHDRKYIRAELASNLEYLVPGLINSGYEDTAEALVREAELFGHDLVLYSIDLDYGYEHGYKNDFHYTDFNGDKFLRIYSQIGDARKLNNILRNMKEEAFNRYSSKYNTKEKRFFYAKVLASFYLYQGNEKKALSTLKRVGGKNFRSMLYSHDKDLLAAFSPPSKEKPTKKQWLKNIEDASKGRFSSIYYKYDYLRHNQGTEGDLLAYEILPTMIEKGAIPPYLVTEEKIHALEHLVKLKHKDVPKLLKETAQLCEKEKCGSKYEDMWKLRLLYNVHSELGNDEKTAEIFENMKSLEEGKMADISSLDSNEKSIQYYLLLDERSTAEDVIDQLKINAGNPELFEVLVKEYAGGKDPVKHLAYLKELLAPSYWHDQPKTYFEFILPHLTTYVLSDNAVLEKISNATCGLLYAANYSSNPEYLDDLSTQL